MIFFLREVSIAPCPLSIPLLFRFVESEECLDLGTFFRSTSAATELAVCAHVAGNERHETSRRDENEMGGGGAWGGEERGAEPRRAGENVTTDF